MYGNVANMLGKDYDLESDTSSIKLDQPVPSNQNWTYRITQKREMGLSVFRPHLSLLMSTPHLKQIVDYQASGFNPDFRTRLTSPITSTA